MILRTTCRVCEGALEPILSLGDHYVSNFILPGTSDGTKAPLELVLCRHCRLLQLKHTVPGEIMYQNYWYRSGTNQTMRTALADIANKAEHLIHLRKGDAVVDIGCNDGTLLASYKTSGIFKIGFDPAENLAKHSREIADHLTIGYFESKPFLADPELRNIRPKVVTSIAMFYDLEDPNTFVADIKNVMRPDGLWIVQMSYLPLMLKTNELGNVCHEHLEYYSLQSFEYLLHLHDFEVVDMELNDVNGGSMRAYIRNRHADPHSFADATYRELAADRVTAYREEEFRMGLDTGAPYREFAVWVEPDPAGRGRLHQGAGRARKEGLRLRRLDEGEHPSAVFRAGPHADCGRRGTEPGQMGSGDRRNAHPDCVGGAGAHGKPRLFPRAAVALPRGVPGSGKNLPAGRGTFHRADASFPADLKWSPDCLDHP